MGTMLTVALGIMLACISVIAVVITASIIFIFIRVLFDE